MGQFALGIRSLLIKGTVFVLLAALLAWALGGTLFPRPETADFPGVKLGNQHWFWRLAVGGRNDGEVRWELMIDAGDDKPIQFRNIAFVEVAGPIAVNDRVYFAGRARDRRDETPLWEIWGVGASSETSHPMPDRLAVEQQLARAAAGLPVQDAETILKQRAIVLDPPAELAD